MTIEETLCTFMDPAPQKGQQNQWWYLCDELGPGWDSWLPRECWDLDILWEIEEKLNDLQWRRYEDLFCFNHPWGCDTRRKLHAKVREKMDALATAISLPVLTWTGKEWVMDAHPTVGCFCGAVIPGACRGFGPDHDDRMKDFLQR